ncbi:hypothetical protein Lal_00033938 [Lupinus albus]|nr:hypothetical protein Lal_00033938 [Lupinus albus]
MDLLDIPLSGKCFTWVKGDNRTMSRLDGFLISHEWPLQWHSFVQKGLKRFVSDHCDVVLSPHNRDWGPKPFRVLSTWFEDKNFATFVEQSWVELQFYGWRMFALKEKLKKLKSNLKTWNKELFGVIDNKIYYVTQEIHELDLMGIVRRVGDGSTTSLYHDIWSLHANFVSRFKRIYFRLWKLGRWKMGVELRLETSTFYLGIVAKPNSWEWRHDKSKQHSIRSAYKILSHNMSKSPLKVTTFTSRLFQDNIPTKEVLSIRGILLHNGGGQLCSFCKESPEFSHHLFSSCNITYPVWKLVYKWLDIIVALAFTPANHFINHMCMVKDRKRRKIRSVIWLATVWAIWLSRNDLIFNSVKSSLNQIFE